MLKDAFRTVKKFNFLARRSTRHLPFMPGPDLKKELARRIYEEVSELMEAETPKDVIDALVDIIYVTLDAFCILGFHPSPFFEIVSRANLRKVWPDGWMRTNDSGKVIKPAGWVGPDAEIEAEIFRQVERAALLQPTPEGRP